jgi:hypothetical protein
LTNSPELGAVRLAATSSARQGQDLAGDGDDAAGRGVADGGEKWYLGLGAWGLRVLGVLELAGDGS